MDIFICSLGCFSFLTNLSSPSSITKLVPPILAFLLAVCYCMLCLRISVYSKHRTRHFTSCTGCCQSSGFHLPINLGFLALLLLLCGSAGHRCDFVTGCSGFLLLFCSPTGNFFPISQVFCVSVCHCCVNQISTHSSVPGHLPIECFVVAFHKHNQHTIAYIQEEQTTYRNSVDCP